MRSQSFFTQGEARRGVGGSSSLSPPTDPPSSRSTTRMHTHSCTHKTDAYTHTHRQAVGRHGTHQNTHTHTQMHLVELKQKRRLLPAFFSLTLCTNQPNLSQPSGDKNILPIHTHTHTRRDTNAHAHCVFMIIDQMPLLILSLSVSLPLWLHVKSVLCLAPFSFFKISIPLYLDKKEETNI